MDSSISIHMCGYEVKKSQITLWHPLVEKELDTGPRITPNRTQRRERSGAQHTILIPMPTVYHHLQVFDDALHEPHHDNEREEHEK